MQKEILITNDDRLKDIQASFSDVYPFLTIEFQRKETQRPAMRSGNMDLNTTIKELINLKAPYHLNINSDRTVALLLADLDTCLGLYVRMCRKSGNVWNAISITDEWTLENQNAAGEYICSVMDANDKGDASENRLN